jgi:hypothetical protein
MESGCHLIDAIWSFILWTRVKQDLGHHRKKWEGPNSLASERVVGPNLDGKKKKKNKQCCYLPLGVRMKLNLHVIKTGENETIPFLWALLTIIPTPEATISSLPFPEYTKL